MSGNPPMISSDVAKHLHISISRVHELDDRLKPERAYPSGVRIYRYAAVAAEQERRIARARKESR